MAAPRRTAVGNDKPTINDTIAALEAEAVRPGPYVLGSGEGRITFPDPGEMDWKEGEEWVYDLGVKRDSELFAKWLDADNYAKLEESGLTMAGKVVLTKKLQQHYGAIFGTPGEGLTSGS